jgi:hypothetical protein
MTMDESRHVDGNAIAGLMVDVFGREMTAAVGCCAGCGAVNAMAALLVFRSGPGDVVRCPACGTVVLVVSSLRDGSRVHLVALRWFEPPA